MIFHTNSLISLMTAPTAIMTDTAAFIIANIMILLSQYSYLSVI